MPDAIAAALARKVALDTARAALRSGAQSELVDALQGLPPHGPEANRLRGLLTEALACAGSPSSTVLRQGTAVATCVSDGIRYEFRIAETGDVAFFVANRVGAQIRVTINAVHPFGKQLSERDDWDNPVVFALLAAWAHYELDQSNEKRQQVARDSRVDWGRVIRRLLSADRGFQLE